MTWAEVVARYPWLLPLVVFLAGRVAVQLVVGPARERERWRRRPVDCPRCAECPRCHGTGRALP